ncbi:arsenate reductase family protein [Cohnella sp. JJ-181]|uniref:arsenate reductase family protein n=1 Tax=Cohnella rhizoplanae TaxID=2974897 RepID=UPI0022FF6A4A|nr:arsenate reductase family protein [Cohnella sp. JJ-181]CAI6046247.1 Regulatory protein MgsR [Cohnella sp. JJ-181]
MPKRLTVYQYSSCDTCRKAVKTLQAQGHELELIHIKETPPSVETLRKLVADSGLPIGKWFNTAGDVYRSLGLKDRMAGLTEDEKLELLAGNGMLIKRPVVTDGVQVTVGYREEELKRAYDD